MNEPQPPWFVPSKKKLFAFLVDVPSHLYNPSNASGFVGEFGLAGIMGCTVVFVKNSSNVRPLFTFHSTILSLYSFAFLSNSVLAVVYEVTLAS